LQVLVTVILVREEDGLTFDRYGSWKYGKKISSAAQQIGLPIVRIVATHAHGDHIGSLDEYMRCYLRLNFP